MLSVGVKARKTFMHCMLRLVIELWDLSSATALPDHH